MASAGTAPKPTQRWPPLSRRSVAKRSDRIVSGPPDDEGLAILRRMARCGGRRPPSGAPPPGWFDACCHDPLLLRGDSKRGSDRMAGGSLSSAPSEFVRALSAARQADKGSGNGRLCAPHTRSTPVGDAKPRCEFAGLRGCSSLPGQPRDSTPSEAPARGRNTLTSASSAMRAYRRVERTSRCPRNACRARSDTRLLPGGALSLAEKFSARLGKDFTA